MNFPTTIAGYAKPFCPSCDEEIEVENFLGKDEIVKCPICNKLLRINKKVVYLIEQILD